jgi:hypothetical protein
MHITPTLLITGTGLLHPPLPLPRVHRVIPRIAHALEAVLGTLSLLGMLIWMRQQAQPLVLSLDLCFGGLRPQCENLKWTAIARQ